MQNNKKVNCYNGTKRQLNGQNHDWNKSGTGPRKIQGDVPGIPVGWGGPVGLELQPNPGEKSK